MLIFFLKADCIYAQRKSYYYFKQNVKDAEAEDLMTKKMYPKREEFQWRPSPILCKRFDLTDPYMGKV